MAAGKYKHKVYWDSCVYIAILTGENKTSDEMKTLYTLEKQADDDEIAILTSVVTHVEVLECKLTEDQKAKFLAMMQRHNMVPYSVNSGIAKLAREIRDYYQVLFDKNKQPDGTSLTERMQVPDAIHLATAMHYELPELHTYDGNSKKPKKTDLLKLPRPILGDPNRDIEICIPRLKEKEEARAAAVILSSAKKDDKPQAGLFTRPEATDPESQNTKG